MKDCHATETTLAIVTAIVVLGLPAAVIALVVDAYA